jgi:hypothetical protein
MPTYLTDAQAAVLLGLEARSVRDLCKGGMLKGAVQDEPGGPWKIPLSAVMELMKGNLGSEPPSSTTTTVSGDQISVGEARDSIQAIGRKAQVTVTHIEHNTVLAREFERIQEQIAARPEDPDLDKEELSATVGQIEEEVNKGEEANPSKVERWLKFLAMMAPDILEVVLAALTGPIPGITAAVRVIAERVKAEQAKGGA